MIVTTKVTNIEMTARIRSSIEKIAAKIERFAPKADADELVVKFDVGRITRHHKKAACIVRK